MTLEEYQKSYREKNSEDIKALKREWALANKERVREAQKRYREKNREKINAKNKVIRKNNPEKYKEYSQKYFASNREQINAKNRSRKKEIFELNPENFFKKIIQRLKRRHVTCRQSAQKKYELFDLDVKYLLGLWSAQGGLCALTKKELAHKFHTPFTVSVDRIDSQKGYIKENVQLVCQSANYAKSHFSNEVFLKFWNEAKWNE